jgi:hypothetical protein
MADHGRSPWRKPLSLRATHEDADAGGFPDGNLQYFDIIAQPETCAAETASTEWSTEGPPPLISAW